MFCGFSSEIVTFLLAKKSHANWIQDLLKAKKKLPATNGFIPYVCYWFYGGVNLWNCRSIFGPRTPDRTCWVGSVAVAATPVTRLMIFECLTGAETVTATVMSSRMDAEFVILHAVTCGRWERVGVFSSVWVVMSQLFFLLIGDWFGWNFGKTLKNIFYLISNLLVIAILSNKFGFVN